METFVLKGWAAGSHTLTHFLNPAPRRSLGKKESWGGGSCGLRTARLEHREPLKDDWGLCEYHRGRAEGGLSVQMR